MDEPQNLTLADREGASRPGVPPAQDPGVLATAGRIEEFVSALLKELKARQAYVAGNPLIDRFHHAVRDLADGLWEELPHLTLTIDESRLLWKEQAVYERPLGHDNFAFIFFRDGLRTLAFLPGCERGELREFVEMVAAVRQGRSHDLLATLWHRDFSLIRMEYVDVSEDEALQLPAVDRHAGAGERIPMDEVERVLDAGPVPPEVEAGYDALRLTEADRHYLQREMDLELHRDLAHDVTLALLDQFEMRDQERRRQVVDILREMLPRLLRQADFPTVALIVNELQLLANKTGERDTQELVASLLRDMSEAMAELVSNAEGIDEGPADDELEALLGALQAEAIPTLIRALPAISDPLLRSQVEDALDRLIHRFPRQVTRLLEAEDPMLAAEAATIVARLEVGGAVESLLAAARRPEAIARRSAVAALTDVDGPEVRATLLAALEDRDAMVRVAAVEALTQRGDPGAATHLREEVESRGFAGREPAEQMAYLKALVTLSGEEVVPVLDALLNGRRWWGARHAPSLRASVARALAMVGSDGAITALRRAEGDRVPAVASAARVSLRHALGGFDEAIGTEEES